MLYVCVFQVKGPALCPCLLCEGEKSTDASTQEHVPAAHLSSLRRCFCLLSVNKEAQVANMEHSKVIILGLHYSIHEQQESEPVNAHGRMFTSLTRCLTGRRPPPTPHTLSKRIISLFIVSSTAARSKATLGGREVNR